LTAPGRGLAIALVASMAIGCDVADEAAQTRSAESAPLACQADAMAPGHPPCVFGSATSGVPSFVLPSVLTATTHFETRATEFGRVLVLVAGNVDDDLAAPFVRIEIGRDPPVLLEDRGDGAHRAAFDKVLRDLGVQPAPTASPAPAVTATPSATATPTPMTVDAWARTRPGRVADLTRRDRPPLIMHYEHVGGVTLPPGWAPGVAIGETPDGPVTHYYLADRERDLIVMWDPGNGEILTIGAPGDATMEDREVLAAVARDVADPG
jgi:hypothetical protein